MFSVSIMANAAYAVRPEVGSSREKDATWVGGQFDYDTKTFFALDWETLSTSLANSTIFDIVYLE